MLLIPARHLVVTDKWIFNFLMVFLSRTAGANLLLEMNVNIPLIVTVMSYWLLGLLDSFVPVFCSC